VPGRAIGAAIDVGSNSVHLLVGIVDRGSLEPLDDESVQLGLGDTVDACGLVPDPTRETLIETIRAYVATAERLRAGHLTLVGTEPFRRAGNTTSVAAEVLRRTGHALHVLSHQAEAELTLIGVTHGHHPQDRLLVVDIGGGSTEVILVGAGGEPHVGAVRSGSARLSSLIVRHDPPTLAEIEALRAESGRLVADLPAASPERGVVVGGSGTNLALITRTAGSPPHITIATVERGLALLAETTCSELAATFAITTRRAWQLAAGAAFIEAVSRRYGLDDLEVSTASLREGAILAAWLAGDAWPEQLPALVAPEPGAGGPADRTTRRQ
jgi:exopolyphosphatase / guanosine-5'-triphosphate,3'-diphosphate pyrophosphatase